LASTLKKRALVKFKRRLGKEQSKEGAETAMASARIIRSKKKEKFPGSSMKGCLKGIQGSTGGPSKVQRKKQGAKFLRVGGRHKNQETRNLTSLIESAGGPRRRSNLGIEKTEERRACGVGERSHDGKGQRGEGKKMVGLQKMLLEAGLPKKKKKKNKKTSTHKFRGRKGTPGWPLLTRSGTNKKGPRKKAEERRKTRDIGAR